MIRETLEFTTIIPINGCPIRCTKYCPQEVITKNYIGERNLSLEQFKSYLNTVPRDVIIIFAGLSEPFLNQECPDMILYAHDRGYDILLYTTLVGLKPKDAERIMNVPFLEVFMHLPDAAGISHIPYTRDYIESRQIIETHVMNISFMNMGGKFKTAHCEDMARGTSTVKKTGRVFCSMFDSPQYTVFPNGDVTFCCMGRGKPVIGNIKRESYQQLRDKFPGYFLYMQKDPTSLCHQCILSKPYWVHLIDKAKMRAISNTTINKTLKRILR